MFNNRVTVVSLFIICVAIGMYLFSNTGEKKKESSQFHSFVSPGGVKQIEITRGEKTLKLSPRDNKWFVTDNNSIEIAADSSRILSIFEFINDAKIVQRITKKESSYPDFDVTGSKAAKVVLKDRNKEDQVFYIGKDKDYSSQFVRKEEDPYVYLVSKRLDLNMDLDRWFYKKVPDYDFTRLDYIEYTCNNNKKIKVYFDKEGDKFSIKEVPEGKQVKDLTKLRDDFLKISVSKFLNRSEKIKTTPVVYHTLYFKTGESVNLAFLKSTEEKSSKHYLDIKVDAKESRNKDLKYIKTVSDQYLFSVSRFDKKKYQRDYDDFFEKK